MFSEREKSIIKIIGSKKVTRSYITDVLFPVATRPFHAELVVGNNIRSIIKKCEYYKLKWTLIREKTGTGRQSIFKENL
jgi:hypothetical protein